MYVCVWMMAAWREGIFGFHAVLHKFVIACWMLWSTPSMNISNDPSRGYVCVSCVCVFLSEWAGGNEALDFGLGLEWFRAFSSFPFFTQFLVMRKRQFIWREAAELWLPQRTSDIDRRFGLITHFCEVASSRERSFWLNIRLRARRQRSPTLLG